MSDSEFVYKPQDVNYLGFLEAQLRDMTGVDTLAYKLIQKADEVQNEGGCFQVTNLSSGVTDEALIVHNNGRFRDVDFERLQNIVSSGKRSKAGVTGAFGLGFLAVYQTTDAPEIFSSGRHWIILPEAPTEQRIAEQATGTSGTTFRLEAGRPEQLGAFARQMGEAIAQAAIFLQRLKQLEVRRNGVLIRRIERQHDGDRLLLTDEKEHPTEWLLLNGGFAAAAQQLRQP